MEKSKSKTYKQHYQAKKMEWIDHTLCRTDDIAKQGLEYQMTENRKIGEDT